METMKRIPSRDVRGRMLDTPVRDGSGGRRESIDGPASSLTPLPASSYGIGSGNQSLAASLPPGRYFFEADDNGVRIWLMNDPVDPSPDTINAARDTGSRTTPSIAQIQAMNDAFWRKRGMA